MRFFLMFFIPVLLMGEVPPMGVIFHPVSTKNGEAQKSFNRGLTYVFAYNHDIAFQSFEKAAQLDPTLAMAYWGMALARGQNVNEDVTPEREIQCFHWIQEAQKLSANASPVEKQYIEALATRYTNDPNADFVPLRYRYRDAMRKVVEAYPEDLDATTLYAESILNLNPWRWWGNDGKPLEGTMEAIEKLEFVLSRNPYHIGANHFDIHSWEESPTPQRGLMSAHRLEFLLPESGHLLHMPCHIFLPVGDYEKAIATNKKAIAEDQAYYKKIGLSYGTYPLHYLSHNLYVLTRTYKLMEDEENGIRAAFETSRFVTPFLQQMPTLIHYSNAPLEIYLYFHKWKEILDYSLPAENASEKTYWHFGRAKAYASLGDLPSARKEQEMMKKYQDEISSGEVIANNSAKLVMELAALDLEATFARIEKNTSLTIALLTKAVELQDSFYYDEPPSWYTCMKIPLGAALLEEKKYEEAEALFRDVLKSHLQRNGRALFGLYLSLKGQNKDWDAFWIEREMANALRNASSQLKLEDLN